MPHLSPPTLTHGEQRALLRATRRNHRDQLICSLALGTGPRLAKIVGLNVGDVYGPGGKPENRLPLRPLDIHPTGRFPIEYRTKGKSTCRRYWLRRDPFESFILGRVEKRLQKFLTSDGEQMLRRFIAEEMPSQDAGPRRRGRKAPGRVDHPRCRS